MELAEPRTAAIRAGLAPVLADLVEACGMQRPEPAPDSESTPPLIVQAFEQLFDVTQHCDQGIADQNAPGTETRNITEVGEYALELLDHALQGPMTLIFPGFLPPGRSSTIFPRTPRDFLVRAWSRWTC